MSSVVFDIFFHINCHSIKIPSFIVPFNSWSALYKNVQVIFKFKVNCFVLFPSKRRVFEWQLLWYWYNTFFIGRLLKRSETTDLSMILSYFRMFWHSFCSNARRGIWLEPVLTRKLASLPQNLFCHNPLRKTFPDS